MRVHSIGHAGAGLNECLRVFARRTTAVLPRAARPLAASAPLLVREVLSGRTSSWAAASVSKLRCKVSLVPVSGAGSLCNFWPARCREFNPCSSLPPCHSSAPRRSARPSRSGRAATSFARGGGFCFFASGVTQRTMLAGSVLLCALPNPSINRTCPGKPGHAGYLKR